MVAQNTEICRAMQRKAATRGKYRISGQFQCGWAGMDEQKDIGDASWLDILHGNGYVIGCPGNKEQSGIVPMCEGMKWSHFYWAEIGLEWSYLNYGSSFQKS
jgi:hypothetical protein